MNNRLKVALNMARLPVPDKIQTAKYIINSVSSNSTLFNSPSPSLNTLNMALNKLRQAWMDAQDGGKSKTALMHDAENSLMKLLYDLAHYVEAVADGNPEIVHKAGLSVKRQAHSVSRPDFYVYQLKKPGSVGIRTKPRKEQAFYKWQYTTDPEGEWTTALTSTVSTVSIHNLSPGQKYWFRLVLITVTGEHALEPRIFAVN